MVRNEKKSGISLDFVIERLLFPKIFRKNSYFSGLQEIFVKYCKQRNCLKTKMKIRTKRLCIFSIFAPHFKGKKKVTESETN